MKKLVIFDLDGTLVDTIADCGRCFNETLEYFGFKTYPVEQYGKMVGGNLDVTFSKLLEEKYRTNEIISKLKEKYAEAYLLDSKPNTKPFEGILDALKKLNKENISVAINTNKMQHLAEKFCKDMFGEIDFSGIFGYIEGSPSKPDPTAVNKLMKINNVLPEDTIYVGDGITDIKTAQNAGIDCILVNWGQGNCNEILETNEIPFVANVPSDIFKFL